MEKFFTCVLYIALSIQPMAAQTLKPVDFLNEMTVPYNNVNTAAYELSVDLIHAERFSASYFQNKIVVFETELSQAQAKYSGYQNLPTEYELLRGKALLSLEVFSRFIDFRRLISDSQKPNNVHTLLANIDASDKLSRTLDSLQTLWSVELQGFAAKNAITLVENDSLAIERTHYNSVVTQAKHLNKVFLELTIGVQDFWDAKTDTLLMKLSLIELTRNINKHASYINGLKRVDDVRAKHVVRYYESLIELRPKLVNVWQYYIKNSAISLQKVNDAINFYNQITLELYNGFSPLLDAYLKENVPPRRALAIIKL